jgi:hypothetical protein
LGLFIPPFFKNPGGCSKKAVEDKHRIGGKVFRRRESNLKWTASNQIHHKTINTDVSARMANAD